MAGTKLGTVRMHIVPGIMASSDSFFIPCRDSQEIFQTSAQSCTAMHCLAALTATPAPGLWIQRSPATFSSLPRTD